MGRLGDNFPEADRTTFVEQHLAPGAILYLFCQFTEPPKEKYVVVASLEPRTLLFVINSEIADFLRSDPDMFQAQIELQSSDYRCLDHDSHLDCAKVIAEMTRNEINNQLLADLSRFKGRLTNATTQNVLDIVNGARTISPRDQGAIRSALLST